MQHRILCALTRGLSRPFTGRSFAEWAKRVLDPTAGRDYVHREVADMWRTTQGRRVASSRVITMIRREAVKAWGRWVAVAHVIGNVQARLLLSVFYFVVLPPFALVVKLTGNPLGLDRIRRKSGWTRRPAGEMPPEAWRRQF